MNIEKSTWACRKRLLSFFIMATAVLTASSQTYPPKDSPQLEFVLQLRVHISEPYTIGEIAHGRRIVIPITGGSFEGPSLKGTILSGGADYQLANADGTRTELEAIYSIRTDDRGLVCDGKNADGTPYYYFKAAPQFEAPKDSRYAWLNDALFVCQPEWTTEFKGIVLNVWKVK